MAGVALSEYDPRWASQFAAVAAELQAVFGDGVTVEHIGSTAVPGLCAKPVLDVLLGAERLDRFTAAVPAMAARGFVYRAAYEAEMPERRYFVREAGVLPRVHVHGVVRGGAFWREHLRFRDRLRTDALARDRYAALKRELAAAHRDDKAAYTLAKAPFIRALLDESGAA
jgi:GrpB-like predicted nucleotidyltransferase (UPF0157 family)